MLVIEQILDEIARTLHLDPLVVRRANFYGAAPRNVTPYGQTVEDNMLDTLTGQLAESSGYAARRTQIAAWNATDPVIRRGLALTPVKFGISFTSTVFNQAGALVHVYSDGTVLLNHGGTEMGQGLFTKVAQVVAAELGVPLSLVRVSATDTAKVPNTSASAASASSDLNGKAAQAAARTIRERLVAFLSESRGVDAAQVRFRNGRVTVGNQESSFAEIVLAAYRARVSLSSTGFYRTPKIEWDKARMRGRPFFYFAYGAAVSEVAVDTLDRGNAAAARRHPARRRRFAQSGHRPGTDRRRLPAGSRLADLRATLVECARGTGNPRAVDLQDTDRARLAGPDDRSACWSAHPIRKIRSIAPRPLASRP